MDSKYDILMVGHISKDIMVQGGEEERLTGGAVVYSSAAAARSGARVLVVTKAAPADEAELSVMREAGAEVELIPSKQTTSIRNEYLTADRERRTATVVSRAEPFTTEEIQSRSASILDLAGLIAGELPVSGIPDLAQHYTVAIDAQGVLRHDVNGTLSFKDWDEKRAYLPYVTYLKTDAAEAEILTGRDDRESAAQMLSELGAGEVMVTHGSDVIVASKGVTYRQPLTPRNLSGRTGRGDTCFAAYLARRISHGIDESLEYAAALVSMKLEAPGVFAGTESDVVERMAISK